MATAARASFRLLASCRSTAKPGSAVARKALINPRAIIERTIVSSSERKDAAAIVADDTVVALKDEEGSVSKHGRWAYTIEIMFSKLFPGGFGWQAASGIAEDMGYGADTGEFAALTGCGDMTGVVVGHMTYKTLQKLLTDHRVNLLTELGVSAWLGMAAFMAGGCWQPTVNALHDGLGLGFTPTFIGTVAGCGTMFFVGLRAGRAIMPWMPHGGKAGIKQDAGLALSIGGATGMFVATDLSFVASQSDALYELCSPIFGVLETDSYLLGCCKAGASTFTGFGLFNMAQSVILPSGFNWMDGNNPYAYKESN